MAISFSLCWIFPTTYRIYNFLNKEKSENIIFDNFVYFFIALNGLSSYFIYGFDS